jgi:hypothetical protein
MSKSRRQGTNNHCPSEATPTASTSPAFGVGAVYRRQGVACQTVKCRKNTIFFGPCGLCAGPVLGSAAVAFGLQTRRLLHIASVHCSVTLYRNLTRLDRFRVGARFCAFCAPSVRTGAEESLPRRDRHRRGVDVVGDDRVLRAAVDEVAAIDPHGITPHVRQCDPEARGAAAGIDGNGEHMADRLA